MQVRLGIVMDPIESITFYKDSSMAMLLAAQARGWELYYMEQADLFLENDTAYAKARKLKVSDDASKWYELSEPDTIALNTLNVILMRKDPPWNMEYIYTTIILARAEANGVLVVNRTNALREVNEKLFTAWFSQCCAPTLVTRDAGRLRDFLAQYNDIILKPLDGMGGASIFRLQQGSPNIGVTIETLTHHGQRFTMAQKFLPEIVKGDKRILVIDGEPVPYALARIPAPGETRGNLAAGGHGEGVELSERDRWICEQVAPGLRERGLLFVGLDVIGDYLTEINITSPTCIRELDKIYDLDIGGQLMDCIQSHLSVS